MPSEAALVAAARVHRPRGQRGQRRPVPSVQRQLLHLLGRRAGAQRRRAAVQLSGRSGHVHLLRDARNSQRHLQRSSAPSRLLQPVKDLIVKSRRRNGEAVCTYRQVGHPIGPARRGHRLPPQPRGRLHRLDMRAGDPPPCCVLHRSVKSRKVDLGRADRSGKQHRGRLQKTQERRLMHGRIPRGAYSQGYRRGHSRRITEP
jgi:hypothetical protein